MTKTSDYYCRVELEEPGTFNVRDIPNKRMIHIRLLHHEPGISRVVDTVIEHDEKDGRRVEVLPGDGEFDVGVVLEIRGVD